VFSPGKTAPGGYGRAKTRLDGIIARMNSGEPIQPWVFHDIRRSVASGLAGLGTNLPVIERCLNHVSGSFSGIVAVYQKYNFADEMRAAMDAWGRRIESLTNPDEASNVIELARG
jgi:integrase